MGVPGPVRLPRGLSVRRPKGTIASVPVLSLPPKPKPLSGCEAGRRWRRSWAVGAGGMEVRPTHSYGLQNASSKVIDVPMVDRLSAQPERRVSKASSVGTIKTGMVIHVGVSALLRTDSRQLQGSLAWSPTVTRRNLGGTFSLSVTALAPFTSCLLYTSPSPRDKRQSRMPSSA